MARSAAFSARRSSYDGCGESAGTDYQRTPHHHGTERSTTAPIQLPFLEDINPGNEVKGKLIFDVPKPTKLTAIELHDSMFSGGVKVALS
jgi:hypothetical protein